MSATETDERTLRQIRALSPKRPERKGVRVWAADVAYKWNANSMGDRLYPSHVTCCYCGKRAKNNRMAVNPITMKRHYLPLCPRNDCHARLMEWEGSARKLRSQMEWEQADQRPTPYMMSGGIRTQYDSPSRATVMAFLESGEQVTAVDGGERVAQSLNSSIRSMGMSADVYAELRSGVAVLCRTNNQQS